MRNQENVRQLGSTMKLFAFLTCLLTQLGVNNFQAAEPARPDSVRITPQASGVDASFRGLAVRNEKEAWVTGSKGTVIRTTDAGHTWKRIAVPNSDKLDFRDVEILADGTVLLMSIGNGDASQVLRSTDAGNTWKTVLTNKDPKGFFDGMTFDTDEKKGVLFGDPINDRLDLYRTRDGGVTWQRFPKQQRPLLKKGEYGFAASGSGVVMIGRNIWIATGGSVARVLHSADDGKTWTAHTTPVRSGNESSGIFSIAFVDPKTAVVVGGDYKLPDRDRDNVARSVDGGKTWTPLPSVRMPHKACVRSLGNGRLLTCGRTGVAFSSDAGRTWKRVTKDSYFTLAVDRQSGTGFLAGGDGHVARFEFSNANKE
jgi:photosystem II stability/assembly factor-like uncharacterized protein